MSRILVVDDVRLIREPIAATIRAHGFEVMCAADGKEALALAVVQGRQPDLILLDVNMPGMNGLDCLRALRSLPRTSAIPVILLTGESDRKLVLQAAKLGVSGYVLKSQFSMGQLLERINEQLGPAATKALGT